MADGKAGKTRETAARSDEPKLSALMFDQR